MAGVKVRLVGLTVPYVVSLLVRAMTTLTASQKTRHGEHSIIPFSVS